MVNHIISTSLFDAKEMYLTSHDSKGREYSSMDLTQHLIRIRKTDNMHLLCDLPVSNPNGFPIVQSYNDIVPDKYVSFTERKKYNGKNCCLGFFLYDYIFNYQLWNRLEATTAQIIHYDLVFGPDYSLFVDDNFKQINMMNIFKSRLITAYWQSCGISVLPTASWGDANSFDYCFEGLPEKSKFAVCGIGHDKNPHKLRLFKYALLELERQKRPTMIYVYGGKPFELTSLSCELVFIDDYINKKFRKK